MIFAIFFTLLSLMRTTESTGVNFLVLGDWGGAPAPVYISPGPHILFLLRLPRVFTLIFGCVFLGVM